MGLGGTVVSGEFLLSSGINATPMGGTLRIEVENPLGTEVTIYELRGQYVELARAPQVIPPGLSYITINVSNYASLYRSVAMGNEDVLLMLGVDGINLTATIPLGSATSPGTLSGAVLSMVVENPMNYAITIYNMTGPGFHLVNATVIPPMGTATLRLVITNITNPVGGNLTVILGVMGVNLTEVFTIGNAGLERGSSRCPLGTHSMCT